MCRSPQQLDKFVDNIFFTEHFFNWRDMQKKTGYMSHLTVKQPRFDFYTFTASATSSQISIFYLICIIIFIIIFNWLSDFVFHYFLKHTTEL